MRFQRDGSRPIPMTVAGGLALSRAHQSFSMVDKYSRFTTDNTVAIRLDELAQRQYCWAVEDSLPMAQFLATRMKLPVALIDCPWNRVIEDHANVGRYGDWPTLAAQMPKRRRR